MQRIIGSGRLQEGGQLAVYKGDFNTHVDGGDFRHTASSIDVIPITNLSATNVQTALQELEVAVTSRGTGFISIGQVDGYALGDYNVGASNSTTLVQAFAQAFADPRLQDGGVILVLAGTYYLYSTVIVPPGITIMGENAGTIIVGEMTEQSMFQVDYSPIIHNIGGNIGSGATKILSGSSLNSNSFVNLMLIDNLDGYVAGSGSTMITVPMIALQKGGNLTCERVSFIGRLNNGPVTGRFKTLEAIGTVTGGGSGTVLTVQNCFFDGLKLGINFIPNQGNLDYLTVSDCKARTYGTEDSGNPGVSLNCFLNISLCNAIVTDNYHIGVGGQVNTFLAVASAGASTSVEASITGNVGNFGGVAGTLVNNLSGASFLLNLTSNSWGTNLNNPWYLTVGVSGGDVFGPGAIDLILRLAANSGFSGETVIVNPGTYTITGNPSSANNYANLKFVGNKNGKNYPIFQLNLTSNTQDGLGNRPLALGNCLQSIEFVSINNRHSIRPAFNPTSSTTQIAGGLLEITDCYFFDTACFVADLGASPWTDVAGNSIGTNIIVKDCLFRQTGTFADTISLATPLASRVQIQDCRFFGNGFALVVSHNGYSGSSGNADIVCTNCLFDLTASTISAAVIDSYIAILCPGSVGDNKINRIKLDNCQILADNTYVSGAAPVSSSLLTSDSFTKFVHLAAEDILITDCVFVGIEQNFENASVFYNVPTLFAEPYRTFKISRSKFYAGYLPIQISGSTVLSVPVLRDGITIEHCQINALSQTLIDIDLGLVSGISTSPYITPLVSITDCNFSNGTKIANIQHSSATGAGIYDSTGLVQIYAGQCNVVFQSNTMVGSLGFLTGFNNFAGLVIDNWHSPGATNGSIANTTIVSNNSFNLINNTSTTSATQSSSCGFLRSPVIQVLDNYLSMDNEAGVSLNFVGCLVLDNQKTVSTNYSATMISNNILARRTLIGGSTVLARGYIQITSTSGTIGYIVDNFFDSTTYNNSSTALVEDNIVSGSQWTVNRNKNQTSSLLALFPVGTKSIGTSSFSGQIILAGNVAASTVTASLSSTAQLNFHYSSTDIGTAIEHNWSIDLFQLLPLGVTVSAVTFTYQASAVPSTTGNLTAELTSVNGTDAFSAGFVDTSPHAASISFSTIYDTKPGSNTIFNLNLALNSSTGAIIVISNLTFIYHW